MCQYINLEPHLTSVGVTLPDGSMMFQFPENTIAFGAWTMVGYQTLHFQLLISTVDPKFARMLWLA